MGKHVFFVSKCSAVLGITIVFSQEASFQKFGFFLFIYWLLHRGDRNDFVGRRKYSPQTGYFMLK